jgi:photosystem II stability/assembly factor-like uncharacterized protein
MKRLVAVCLMSLLAGCAGSSQSLAPAAGSAGVGGASKNVAPSGAMMRQIAGRRPVQGLGHDLAAERPASTGTIAPMPMMRSAKKSRWKLLAQLPGAVIHDISFPTLTTGFAAAELGQVWKTTSGGAAWTKIMNLGFPYYWYGVKALDANNIVISGFNDNNFEGIIRWSNDGGTTWSGDIVLSTTGWSDRVRFIGNDIGLVMDQLSTTEANAAHYTTNGGATVSDWTSVVPDPNGGWFGDEFSMLADQHTTASGITYCASTNAGQTWGCGPSIDSVFDGPVFFANDKAGWVGGGEISPNVEGWVHRTTDGGKTWSGRVLDVSWPIREIIFTTPKVGWAAGGNIYSDAGGIYFTKNGGQTWTLDLDSNGNEMSSCDMQPTGKKFQVWCAGYDSSFNGVVYAATAR